MSEYMFVFEIGVHCAESEHDVRAAVAMHEFANVSHHLFAHLYLVLQVYYLQTFSFDQHASISPSTRRAKRLMSNLCIEWNHIKKANIYSIFVLLLDAERCTILSRRPQLRLLFDSSSIPW